MRFPLIKGHLYPFQFSKPARNLSFEVERRSAGLEEGGEGGDTTANSSSFYSTASSPAIAASSEVT